MRRPTSHFAISGAICVLMLASPADVRGQNAIQELMTMGRTDVNKPGDDQLTCQQLEAESELNEARIDQLAREAEQAAMSQVKSQIASQQGASIATQAIRGIAGALLPGIDSIVGAAAQATDRGGMKAAGEKRMSEIVSSMQPMVEQTHAQRERTQYLHMLYADKCMEEAPAK